MVNKMVNKMKIFLILASLWTFVTGGFLQHYTNSGQYLYYHLPSPPEITTPLQLLYTLPPLTFFPQQSSNSNSGQQYGVPSQNSGAPAAAPSQQYGAPSAAPSQQYGAPAAAPSQQYGAPSAAPSQQYGAPAAGAGAEPTFRQAQPQPDSRYGAPAITQNQQQQYGPPPSASKPDSNYGPPAQQLSSSSRGPANSETSDSGDYSITRDVYVHIAPPESEIPPPKAPERPVQRRKKEKNYKIIFIRAPTEAPPEAPEIPEIAELPEEKTLVYVLSKEAEKVAPIVIPTPAAPKVNSPEVYFIKYKSHSGNQGSEEISREAGSEGGSGGY